MKRNRPNPTPQHKERYAKTTLCASLGHALQGLAYVLGNERNARIHLCAAVLVLVASFWLDLSSGEWALIIIAVALVFAGEMLNTVVEIVIDMITLDQHSLAKHAKDVAAGAVLVSAIAAAAMGLLVLGPHLLTKLGLG